MCVKQGTNKTICNFFKTIFTTQKIQDNMLLDWVIPMKNDFDPTHKNE